MPRQPKQIYNRTDRLDYVQSMLHQLRDMAAAERSYTAAYFIEMAYIEISDIIRGTTDPMTMPAGKPAERQRGAAKQA